MKGSGFGWIWGTEGDDPVSQDSPCACRYSNRTLPEYMYKSEACCLCHTVRFFFIRWSFSKMRNLNVDRRDPSFRCNPQAGTRFPTFRLHTLHASCSTHHTSLYGTQTTTVGIPDTITVILPFWTPWNHMGEWIYSFTNFNFRTKWGEMPASHSDCFICGGKPLYPSNRRLGRIHSRSRLFGYEIINLLLLKVSDDPSYFRPVVESLYQMLCPSLLCWGKQWPCKRMRFVV
jgi:hypothetical protein